MPEKFFDRLTEKVRRTSKSLRSKLNGIATPPRERYSGPKAEIFSVDGKLTAEGIAIQARGAVREQEVLRSKTPEKAEATILFILDKLRRNEAIGMADFTVVQTLGDLRTRMAKYQLIYEAEYDAVQKLIKATTANEDQLRYLTALDTLFPIEKRKTEDVRTTAKTEPAPQVPQQRIRPQAAPPEVILPTQQEKMDPIRLEAIKKRLLDISDNLEGLKKVVTYPAERDILEGLIDGLHKVKVEELPANSDQDISVIGSSFDIGRDKNQISLQTIAQRLAPRISSRLGDIGKANIKYLKTDHKQDEYGAVELIVYLR